MLSKIVITYPLPGDPTQFLRKSDRPGVWVNPREEILSRRTLLSQLPGAVGLVATPGDGPIDRDLFDAAGPQLRVVSCYSVGFDYVDIQAAKQREIAVGITPEATTEPTADIAWLLILGVQRKLTRAIETIRDRKWCGIAPGDQYGNRLVGKTLFIIGGGRIGTAVARRAIGWNMKILYLARTNKSVLENAPIYAERVSLKKGLQLADIVSLHVPLNPQTYHLIGAEELHLMKDNAVIINTARGGVIDETALIDALRRGTIGAAGLDVYENEPDINIELYGLDNCLMLPHIGTATAEDRRWMTEIAMQNLLAGIQGEPLPHPVPDH